MSLFGTGRREGVLAALGLAAFALLVHAVGACTGLSDGFDGDRALAQGMTTAHQLVANGELPLWDPAGLGAPVWSRGAEVLYPPWWLLGRGHDAFWLPALAALHAALACALGFRFLRAHGRSRYAAFVCGAAYGLGAQVGCLGGNLGELAALAWVPLALEVFLRLVRGERQRHLAAWLGPTLALPFWTGGFVTATGATVVIVLWLVRYAAHERHRRGRLLAIGATGLVTAALLTAPLWLRVLEAQPAPALPSPHLDLLTPIERVAGPLLLFLAVLGAFRRQRAAPTSRWLSIAVIGAAFALALPYAPSPWPAPAPWHRTPVALWWPVHMALVLLASNGLDDFLDLPLRRRAATAWTLLLCSFVAPAGFLLGAKDSVFHVEAAVLLALAALFAAWRPLGILGFKTVVAAAALVWLATATLYEQARAVRAPAPVPTLAALQRTPHEVAAPGLETATPLLPSRARLAFQLRPGRIDRAAALLPLVATPWTEIEGLPAHFQAIPDGTAAVSLVDEGASWSEYDAHLPRGTGALIIADAYAAGWRATVDGRPTPVLRAANGGRAVLLSPGNHRVRFVYRPVALTLGSQLASAGLLFALAWALAALIREWFAHRKAARDRRNAIARIPPKPAKTAMAAKAQGALRS